MTLIASSSPRHRAVLVFCAAVAVAIVFAAMAVRFHRADQFTYVNWGDRDLVRTARLMSQPETTGAELSYGNGARIPGGAQYYVMAIPLAVGDSALSVYRFMLLLDALSIIVLFCAIRRVHGTWAGLIACATYSVANVLYDNMPKLWNPGFLPLFVTLAYYFLLRVVVDKRASALKWAIACLGLAAQMHFSGVLLLILFLVVLLRFPRPGMLRQIPWAVLALLVVYVPYIADEATNGWTNSRLMFQQYQVEQVTQVAQAETRAESLRANIENISSMLWFFSGADQVWRNLPALGAPIRVLANVVYGITLAFALAVPLRWLYHLLRRRGTAQSLARDQIAFRALLIVFGLGVSYYVWDLKIHLHRGGSGRYLQVLLPAFCGMAGIASATLGDWLGRRSNSLVKTAVAVIVAASLSIQAVSQWEARSGSSVGALFRYSRLTSTLDHVKTETGWSLAELAGRTTLMLHYEERGGWYWTPADSIDFLIHQEGAAFPGSLPGPCGVLLHAEPTILSNTTLDEAFLTTAFAQPIPDLDVLRVVPIADDLTFVEYSRGDGPCNCSFSQRYILTPEEDLLREIYHTQPVGSTGEFPPPTPNTRRFSALLVPPNKVRPLVRIGLLIDITQNTEGISATLHSNQLRGQAYNGDFYSLGMLGHPRLRWQDADGEAAFVLPFAHDLVGHKGVLTPLTASGLQLPAGNYFVYFETETILDVEQEDWPMENMQRDAASLLLTDTYVVK